MIPTIRLLLDEMISPSLSSRLWDEGLDNYPIRDRGMLGAEDHEVWRRAFEENRTLVTINERHFRQYALKAEYHSGLIAIPDGGKIDHQFNYIMAAIEKVGPFTAGVDAFANHLFQVCADYSVEIDIRYYNWIRSA